MDSPLADQLREPRPAASPRTAGPGDGLTAWQRDVAVLASMNYTAAQIGARLGMSKRNAVRLLARVYQVTGTGKHGLPGGRLRLAAYLQREVAGS